MMALFFVSPSAMVEIRTFRRGQIHPLPPGTGYPLGAVWGKAGMGLEPGIVH